MRALFWLLAVFAVAVALVILGRVGAGYVMFVYPPYRVELSLLFFVVASLAGFLLLYAAMRLLGHAVSLPTYVRAYRSRRRRERAHAALAAALAEEYKVQANVELLRRSASDPGAFERRWRGIPAPDQLQPRVAAAAARYATALGKTGLARDILEKALAAEWTPQLVALYGDLPPHLEPAERAAEARARLERGERWLLEHERDAQLLAVLGRLCAHAELWGKARSFLEASLSFEEGRGAHLDLARLAERLGEGAEAERHYRRAAELT